MTRLQTQASQGLEHGEVEQMIYEDGKELLRLLLHYPEAPGPQFWGSMIPKPPELGG